MNAQPGVVGFYARRGFAPGRWEGCSSCPRGVPVAKALAAGLPGAPGPRGAMASARVSAGQGVPLAAEGAFS